MNRLLAAGVGVGIAALLVVVLLGREPAETAAPVEPPLPEFTARLELGPDGFDPPKVRVPKDHRVRLLVLAGPEAPEGLLIVDGYGDRVAPTDIGPGVSREIAFVSALPGDDFALRVGDRILGRLEVTGSHLEEGHR